MKTAVSELGPALRTALPGEAGARVIADDSRLISPSYTRGYPLVAKRGEGMYLEDVDGNRFLDFTAGIAVCSTGHCHPEVVRAIQAQAAELLHMSGTDFYYPQMTAVAERLSRHAPMPGPHRCFFGNSGAEAVEAAMKLARYKTRRPGFIAFYNAFHGRTFGALSLTNSKAAQRAGFLPLLPNVAHIAYPDPWRSAVSPEAESEACLQDLERVFHTVLPPGEVAAVFFEPVQGEGGYVVPPAAFVRGLREVCDRHGILLVADEVQSGCGRTGKMWAIEHFGVAPDIVCAAKGVASGLPLGVMMAPASLMDWPPGAHASTFGGNPVSLAAAVATLDLLEGSLVANSAAVGGHLQRRMRAWPERHACIGQVRGLGLMIGIEIVSDRPADGARRAADPERRDHIVDAAFGRGLLLLGCGASAIRLMPPLICSREQGDAALDILEACLDG